MTNPPRSELVVGSPVHATSLDDATRIVLGWAGARESRTVLLANVHMIMEAHDAPDFRAVMEEASRRDLSAFFEAWIHGPSIPKLRFSHKRTGETVVLRFEHLADVIPVPVTTTVTYADGRTQQIIVPVTERVVERKITLAAPLRKIEVNNDNAALAEFAK